MGLPRLCTAPCRGLTNSADFKVETKSLIRALRSGFLHEIRLFLLGFDDRILHTIAILNAALGQTNYR
jgi:hypothetical protein